MRLTEADWSLGMSLPRNIAPNFLVPYFIAVVPHSKSHVGDVLLGLVGGK